MAKNQDSQKEVKEGTFIDKNGVTRDSNGKMMKGTKAPNPSGLPKNVSEVRKIAQQWTEESIEQLGHIMRHAEKDRDRIEAAKYLLDRGYGKPSTSVEVQHDSGNVEQKTIELSKLSRHQLEQLEDMIDLAKDDAEESD
jgi:hypothetical protein